jgi:GntR family transcriptional regulator
MTKHTAAKASPPDLSLSPAPRYAQLAVLFRRRIETGVWAKGNQIPTIDELVSECGVARATIRQALGMLERDGLVERLRAKGTFVTGTPQDQVWCEVQTDWSGLLLSREGASIEVLYVNRGVAPPPLPRPIGDLAPTYRHLRRRHSRQGQAYLLADIWVDETLAKRIPSKDFASKPALSLIAGIPGVEIVDAHQTLTIGAADIEAAQMLKIQLNQPVAHVHRCAVAKGGRVLLIANGVYRGDVVRLDMRLK